MKSQFSRREFLKGTATTAMAAVASFGVVGQILNNPVLASSNSVTTTGTPMSELEQWLLSTGKEELGTELYNGLHGVSYVYLPLIVR